MERFESAGANKNIKSYNATCRDMFVCIQTCHEVTNAAFPKDTLDLLPRGIKDAIKWKRRDVREALFERWCADNPHFKGNEFMTIEKAEQTSTDHHYDTYTNEIFEAYPSFERN